MRGFLLNFGVYYATRAALGLPFEWRWAIVLSCIIHNVVVPGEAVGHMFHLGCKEMGFLNQESGNFYVGALFLTSNKKCTSN